MKKKGKKSTIDRYADLEGDVDQFDLDESDDGLGKDERIMVDNARGRRLKEVEEEVLNVYHSSDESEDDDEEEDEESVKGISDLEDGEEQDDDLPDAKAWGSQKKSYYSTDYVDKDYLGFDDEEAALMEEQEANEIQKRILNQMEDTDFSLGLLDKVEDKKKETKEVTEKVEKEKVEKNLSKLSKSELIDVIKNETPGFFGLLKECKQKLKNLEEQVLPILDMEKSGELPECEALEFLTTYHKVVNYFVMNTAFFMLLKSKREKTEGHPIVQRLGQISMYLTEMDACFKAGLEKQIRKILNDKKQGFAIVEKTLPSEPTPSNRKERRKVEQLKKEEKTKEEEHVEKAKRKLTGNREEMPMAKRVKFNDLPEEEEDREEEEEEDDKVEKRAASYQMLKNKGLTPKRKKEVRNPRVRNRNKFKKAVVRRKGQVREVRKEIQKYGGEMSGIKKYLSKSIKLK